ncbi:RidA family protein [Burkholderia ubonensis]|uniref:RidA family protein n=1 Tax=Burkholderia ubonensis TaxID=101571 RepID=UPI002ABE7E17|nr:RidA family protein [Burkholderia ubonensis]
MRTVSIAGAPTPVGHYSHAVEANGFLFLSGVLPTSPLPGEQDDFERQVRATLAQCERVLQAAGYRLADVVQCTAYIVGVAHWPQFNAVYAEVLGSHRPARTVVPVAELHHGWLTEIQLVAYRGHDA